MTAKFGGCTVSMLSLRERSEHITPLHPGALHGHVVYWRLANHQPRKDVVDLGAKCVKGALLLAICLAKILDENFEFRDSVFQLEALRVRRRSLVGDTAESVERRSTMRARHYGQRW